MPQIANVQIDPMDKAAVMALLSGVKNGYPKAMSRALNAGLSTARVEARREVQKEVTAKTKYVNRAFAENKATYGNLAASLVGSGKPVPLIAYDVRQNNTGVSVKVNKSGARSMIPGGFIATVKAAMKSGAFAEHQGVFVRKTNVKGKGKWAKGKRVRFRPSDDAVRLPVRQLFGPSIPAIFERGPIMEAVEAKASAKMVNELDRQVGVILDGVK